jgi:glycosyltransferase involved in cell wall biosynthesis
LEIILINDGSKDDSLIIAKEFEQRDSRVHLIDKENEGVAATRNVGLENASGDYILFVDSDDWIELDMVEFLVEKAEAVGCDIVTCKNILENVCPSEIEEKKMSFEETMTLFLKHRELDGALWSKLMKRSLLKDISFDPTVGYGEDALFFWEVLIQKKPSVLLTNRPLYYYRMNAGSISHVFGKQKFTAFNVWKIITDDTQANYPHMQSLANASFCNQMLVILYEASICAYPYDENIAKLQEIVRENFGLLYSEYSPSLKKLLMGYLIVRYYRLMSFILRKYI